MTAKFECPKFNLDLFRAAKMVKIFISPHFEKKNFNCSENHDFKSTVFLERECLDLDHCIFKCPRSTCKF